MFAILLARVMLWTGNWVAYVVPACNNRFPPLPLHPTTTTSQHGATFLWLSWPWPPALLHNKVILYCEYCVLAVEHSRKPCSCRGIQTKTPWLTRLELALDTAHPESSRFPSRSPFYLIHLVDKRLTFKLLIWSVHTLGIKSMTLPLIPCYYLSYRNAELLASYVYKGAFCTIFFIYFYVPFN